MKKGDHLTFLCRMGRSLVLLYPSDKLSNPLECVSEWPSQWHLHLYIERPGKNMFVDSCLNVLQAQMELHNITLFLTKLCEILTGRWDWNKATNELLDVKPMKCAFESLKQKQKDLVCMVSARMAEFVVSTNRQSPNGLLCKVSAAAPFDQTNGPVRGDRLQAILENLELNDALPWTPYADAWFLQCAPEESNRFIVCDQGSKKWYVSNREPDKPDRITLAAEGSQGSAPEDTLEVFFECFTGGELSEKGYWKVSNDKNAYADFIRTYDYSLHVCYVDDGTKQERKIVYKHDAWNDLLLLKPGMWLFVSMCSALQPGEEQLALEATQIRAQVHPNSTEWIDFKPPLPSSALGASHRNPEPRYRPRVPMEIDGVVSSFQEEAETEKCFIYGGSQSWSDLVRIGRIGRSPTRCSEWQQGWYSFSWAEEAVHMFVLPPNDIPGPEGPQAGPRPFVYQCNVSPDGNVTVDDIYDDEPAFRTTIQPSSGSGCANTNAMSDEAYLYQPKAEEVTGLDGNKNACNVRDTLKNYAKQNTSTAIFFAKHLTEIGEVVQSVLVMQDRLPKLVWIAHNVANVKYTTNGHSAFHDFGVRQGTDTLPDKVDKVCIRINFALPARWITFSQF